MTHSDKLTFAGPMSAARWATVAGLAAGAAGIWCQRLAGVSMPVVPPGLVLLVAAAVLVALVRRRWTPIAGVVVALAEIGGLLATGSLTDLADLSPAGVFLSTWLRSLGVLAAFVAGVVAVVTHQSAPARDHSRAEADH
ncbi:MAG TPA: hypothetical protein VFU43_03775 [Streptosporangiaceae bacterium]|nr:hypothetical protein [Streptosporangiaceae bacterium]